MNTYELNGMDREVTRIAYGCMEIARRGPGTGDEVDLAHTRGALEAAFGAGIRFFDHADIYGRGKSEEVFGRIWPELCSREEIVIQTKCGIRFREGSAPHRYDFSHEHIMNSVELSLQRLQTEYVDILLLHRPDILAEPAEIARAFGELHASGKVRAFGVSNHNPGQIELLRAELDMPIVANQLELSLLHSGLFAEGVHVNQRVTEPPRSEGTLEYCRLHDIRIQAWSPLARGKVTRASGDGSSPAVDAARQAVEGLAHRYEVTGEAILLAWILRHPAGIQPVLGSSSPERIRNACRGDSISLTREEWYGLFLAGRGLDGLP